MLTRSLFTVGLTMLLAVPIFATPRPSPLAMTRPALIVLNKSDNELVVVDLTTKKITGRVPVGMGPHEVVTSPDGATAFVANYDDGASPGSTIKTMTFGEKISTGAVPDGMAILK